MSGNRINSRYLRLRLALALTLIAASVTAFFAIDFFQSRHIRAQTALAELLEDTLFLAVDSHTILEDVVRTPSQRLARSAKSRLRRPISQLAENTGLLKETLTKGATSEMTRELLSNRSLDPVGTLEDFVTISGRVRDTPELWGDAANRHVTLARSLITQLTPVIRRLEDIERSTLDAAVQQLATARLVMTGVIGMVLVAIWIFIFAPMQKSILNAQEESARQKRAAEAASKSKSDFLATISHEIRTPMNGVLGMADLLADTRLDAAQRDLLDTISDSGRSLLTIINDVLDFSKIEAGRIRLESVPIDLRRLLDNLHRMLSTQSREKDIGFSVDLPDDLAPRHLGDEVRLRQILTNLAGNAIKFTEEGAVTIHLSTGPPSGGMQSLCFCIEDTGIGMSSAQLSRIFNKFEQADSSTTRRFGGTGLGLSIAKSLAETMGGSLTASSTVGAGTRMRFEVALPVAEITEKTQGNARKSEEEIPVPPGIRVLVADDNAVNRKLAEMMLKKSGCQVILAENGAQAVDLFMGTSPDIIFMDVSMPVMSGHDATRSIRSEEARQGSDPTPIIALSAHVGAEFDAQCSAAGMDGILHKPITKTELRSALLAVAIPSRAPPDTTGRQQMKG